MQWRGQDQDNSSPQRTSRNSSPQPVGRTHNQRDELGKGLQIKKTQTNVILSESNCLSIRYFHTLLHSGLNNSMWILTITVLGPGWWVCQQWHLLSCTTRWIRELDYIPAATHWSWTHVQWFCKQSFWAAFHVQGDVLLRTGFLLPPICR